ncbi:MAG: hypothetical protein KJ722_03350, partial [Candidatus Omnitrophica bacterium]|nr:hypothetical protein [Candidatus Omnitrophota bacterium]
RAAWQRQIQRPQEIRKRLKLLLNCDIEIKTGKAKPGLALERFIVSLCGFSETRLRSPESPAYQRRSS